MKPAIKVEHLTKRFGDFVAVDDVDFEAAEGRITALLGPSGSGKSTVLRMIAGLETPTSGRIWMEEEEHTHSAVQDRRVGFVFQHYALFRHMTVEQNVGFGLAVRKAPKDEVRARVDELLSLVQLAPYRDRYPDQLSGGQRQRVALARALAPRPKVLLLDEPFGALDARVRQDLRRWLDDLHRELGVTSLLVTHDQDEALELAHRVVVMHEGGVEQIGTPAEIYEHPASTFVAGFVGVSNVVDAEAARRLAGSEEAFIIRPEKIRLGGADGPATGGAVAADGAIEGALYLGAATRYAVRLDAGATLLVLEQNEEDTGPAWATGQRVRLIWQRRHQQRLK
jgi:sulfate ABC transporter ATP-binding protein